MESKTIAAKRNALHPKPAVLVSCRDAQGRDNALAVEYCCNCSFDPPMIMVAIHPARHSHAIIKETGVFVANLVPASIKRQFEYLGSKSGRDGDKLAFLGMNLGQAETIDAPLLLDCPVCIECTVADSIRAGSHELFIGKIERVHADESLVGEGGAVDWSRVDFLGL